MSSNRFLATAQQIYRAVPSGWTAGMDLYQRRRYGKGRAPTRLDVMTSFEGKHLGIVQVMLQSLSDSHPHDEIVFWFLELDAAPRQLAALSNFCARLGNITLRPLKVPHAADFTRLKTLGGKPDSARYLWFVAHELLPPEVKRVIYLDASDIIVTDDLVPLLNHPFLGRYLVACREIPSVPALMIGPACQAHRRGAPAAMLQYMSKGLINSGAIVLNLDKFRRDGIGIGHYLDVAQWAREELDLGFGDQGLFSLTHGSHYTRAHDRYNHRFHTETRDKGERALAVIHFAGKIPKPAHWRLTPELEALVTDHLRRTNTTELALNLRGQRMTAAHIPYFRRWWQVCAQTPCHARLAPQADKRTLATLERAGVTLG